MPAVSGSSSKYVVIAGWDHAPHLTEKDKTELLGSALPHERDARSKGIPALGSGAIFPVPDDLIKCAPFAIPAHWPRLAAMDFGWTHPTAAIWIAWDRDADSVYVYDCHRQAEAPPVIHAAAINARGMWINMAWPHDGENETAGGEALKQQYRELGVNMLPERAHYEDAERHNSVEAGLADMLDRMMTGRLKVFAHLNDWFEEKRLYHRKDGKVVKIRDDLMSATRYGIMMLRYAITKPNASGFQRYRGT